MGHDKSDPRRRRRPQSGSNASSGVGYPMTQSGYGGNSFDTDTGSSGQSSAGCESPTTGGSETTTSHHDSGSYGGSDAGGGGCD